MENKETVKKQEETKATSPQTTDNPQLDIETVTPDTQQTVPQTHVNTAKVDTAITGANQNAEERSVTPQATAQEKEMQEKPLPKEGTKASKPADNDSDNDEEEDDERDKIETVSP